MLKNNKGFTLVELLIVIAIISVLATLAITSLSSARLKSRDVKRISDMKELSTALFMYYNRQGFYPTAITPGQPIVSPDGKALYMQSVPANPLPQDDNPCTTSEYKYSATPSGNDYHIYFCTGANIDQATAGAKFISPSGITETVTPGMCGGLFQGACANGKYCCPSSTDLNNPHCYGTNLECTDRACKVGIIGGIEIQRCAMVNDSCNSKEDCSSGICENNNGSKICVCRDQGFACIGDNNCCSESCQYGICQVGQGSVRNNGLDLKVQ